ncbi:MAG TPA: M13 family metallopeptidase, partial [Gemmatimonadaceae bacterium]|nr:M13 family metallopeptidase [Gemmatimonadaceae bacterium]
MRTLLYLTLAAAVSAASAQSPAPLKPIPPLKLSDLDRSTKACVDFYQFANGGWLASNPVPPAFSSWGSFTELTERNYVVLREVLESSARAAKTTANPNTKKLGTYFASCMDSAGAEAAGAKPIGAGLARIAAISSRPQLNAAIAHIHSMGLAPLFSFGADQDAKNSSLIVLAAGQGGLGLPNRDYYTKTDANSEKIRTDYVAHLTKTFELLGESPDLAKAHATKVLALETRLANASRTPVQLRDPIANYNPMPVIEINTMTPGFDWNAFMAGLGITGISTIDVGQPEYFKAMSVALQEVPLDDWKAYLSWRVADRMSPYLSSAFVNQNFAFRSILSGARQMQPRWRRCLTSSDQVLGEALGQEYVKVAFTPAAKSKALEMIENLRTVMRERITKAAWMTEATKKQALTKLAAFNRKIGYPDVWRDYSALRVEEAPYATNYLYSRAFAVKRDLAKLGKPVDRGEWFMTPPTVNAYFAPQLNEIAFPAGRLQPPFFHPSYDDGANYGGIGGT